MWKDLWKWEGVGAWFHRLLPIVHSGGFTALNCCCHWIIAVVRLCLIWRQRRQQFAVSWDLLARGWEQHLVQKVHSPRRSNRWSPRMQEGKERTQGPAAAAEDHVVCRRQFMWGEAKLGNVKTYFYQPVMFTVAVKAVFVQVISRALCVTFGHIRLL